MIKNYVPSKIETSIDYELEFMVDRDGGFGFPCDKDGNLLEMADCAKKNYEYCMAHPEEFKYAWNEVKTYKRQWRQPASGDCECGEHIDLFDEYYGACQCPKCGQWYNLFGQELLPPEDWEKDPNEYEY